MRVGNQLEINSIVRKKMLDTDKGRRSHPQKRSVSSPKVIIVPYI